MSGGLLLVSQFTLAADTRSGTRPGFSTAAAPERARQLFEYLLTQARAAHPQVATGEFGADMQVSLTNDGPVTFWLETGIATAGDPEVVEFDREVYCAAAASFALSFRAMLEILIIVVVLLLIFGAGKVRSAGSDLGAAVKGFRKATAGPAPPTPRRTPPPTRRRLPDAEFPEVVAARGARERQARCLR